MITEELLKQLYLKQNKTRKQIANELNVPKSQVIFYCWKYHMHKDTKTFEKTCPVCAKRFKVNKTNKDQIYCCVSCMRIGSRKALRKTCPNCGKEVIVYYKGKEFCNKKCKNEYKAKQNLISHKRVCQHCKKEYDYYKAMPNWFHGNQKNGLKYHGVDSSKYCSYECGIAHRQEVSRKTCKNKYGVEFTIISENNLKKSKITKLKRYGNEKYTNSKQISLSLKKRTLEEKQKTVEKAKKTKFLRYGDENYNGNKQYTEEELKIREEKIYNTKKKNNSFRGKGLIDGIKCSLCEEQIYRLLKKKYETIDFEKFIFGYGRCDFYIPELDLYIEYQGIWTHGSKPFEGTEEDIKKLNKWKEKNKAYYKQAIYTWTKLDVKKRKIANDLNLNWIEFFNMEQFMNWYNNA